MNLVIDTKPNRFIYKRKTDAATEPVSRAEAKLYLRLDSSAEDTQIDSFIKTARTWVEQYTNKSLITQTWELILDYLQDEIPLKYAPVQSITSVKTYDDDNIASTVTNTYYRLDTYSGKIFRNTNYYYSDYEQRENGAVLIEYIAGYGAAANVPDVFKSAILHIVSNLYNKRDCEESGNDDCIIKMLAPYREFKDVDMF